MFLAALGHLCFAAFCVVLSHIFFAFFSYELGVVLFSFDDDEKSSHAVIPDITFRCSIVELISTKGFDQFARLLIVLQHENLTFLFVDFE